MILSGLKLFFQIAFCLSQVGKAQTGLDGGDWGWVGKYLNIYLLVSSLISLFTLALLPPDGQ